MIEAEKNIFLPEFSRRSTKNDRGKTTRRPRIRTSRRSTNNDKKKNKKQALVPQEEAPRTIKRKGKKKGKGQELVPLIQIREEELRMRIFFSDGRIEETDPTGALVVYEEPGR